ISCAGLSYPSAQYTYEISPELIESLLKVNFPYLVTTRMSRLRKPSFAVPSVERFVRDTVQSPDAQPHCVTQVPNVAQPSSLYQVLR
uniref:Uncharacterized protein LOC113799001 n=1 Tax=Dermatophagoides pteronyssinus TaxID=6956 RepID=A0A6P6YKG7_DERPT